MRAAAILCVLVMTTANAGAQGLEYGVKGGVNLSTFQSDTDGTSAPYDLLAGLVAGASITWPLGSRLAFEPDVFFSQKGAKADAAGGKLTQRVDYLEIPLLATFRVAGSPGRHLTVLGGASIGWRLRARARATFGNDTLETDITDEVKSYDFGVVGGAAWHRGRLVVEGRYTFGFTDLDDSDAAVTVKNRTLSILAGWKL
jgi:hypothetical protein